jgi:hypothetical protein
MTRGWPLRRVITAAIVLLLAVAFVPTPATGGTSVASKLKTLTKQFNALRGLVLLNQTQEVHSVSYSAFAQTDSNGYAAATAICPPGTVATGGGAKFLDIRVGDSLVYSRPVSAARDPHGWVAAGRKVNALNDSLEVFVVCTKYGF